MSDVETVFAAVQAADWDGLRRLLEEDPTRAGLKNEEGLSLLVSLLYHRQPELAALVWPSIEQPTIHEAAAYGDAAALRRALEEDPARLESRSPDGFTALHLAAFFARQELVQLLLERGADVGVVADNPSQVQALHSATAGGDLACVQALLAADANPDAPQQGGFTPLMSAAAQGSEPMVRALLEAGADAAIASEDGSTAASLAEARGHESLRALLR